MQLAKILAPFKDRRKIYELFVGLGLLAILSVLAATRWLDPFENLFLDLRYRMRGQRPFPAGITLIGVEEASIDKFGRWPWPRDRYAELLYVLGNKPFRPAVIAYDILFEEKVPQFPEGDANLVYRTKNFGSPVIMSYFFERGKAYGFERDEEKEKFLENFALPPSDSMPESLQHYDKVSLPFLELAEVSRPAFVNTPQEKDGRTRKAQLLAGYRGKIYPSMDLLAALAYWGAQTKDVRLENRAIVIEKSEIGPRRIPVNARGEMLINYYCDWAAIPQMSFLGALERGAAWIRGESPEELRKLMKDKIVLVGVTAQGLGDRRVTPFQEYEPGVSLHAQTIANILNQDFLVRARPNVSYTALLLLGLTVIFLTMFVRITYSLAMVLGLGMVYFFISLALFWKGLWIDVAVQELATVTLFIGITSFRYFTALEELKRAQEQVIQSTKMASLGQLSAGISHEFRNILNAVNLHVEYCSRPGVPHEKVVKYLGTIKGIMDNANLILNGLLTFARKSESVKRPGDLKKTIESTLLLIEKEMMRHEIMVQTELEEVPEISYDAGQISQVLMNLMNNSRDALKDKPEGKQITIGLKNEPAALRLDIGDNGSGIPPQVLKRLFEPFVTSKPAGKGTGLGLSVCHGIIRNHGGDIKVTTAQGKGTTWHIYLPKR